MVSAVSDLRVSDDDRDRAVAELSENFEAGRITQAEFGERSSRALQAKTEGELAGLFADLPRRRASAVPLRPAEAGPVGPAHVGLPRPVRFTAARIAIAAVAITAVAGALSGGAPDHRFRILIVVPILVVLFVIRRLASYR